MGRKGKKDRKVAAHNAKKALENEYDYRWEWEVRIHNFIAITVFLAFVVFMFLFPFFVLDTLFHGIRPRFSHNFIAGNTEIEITRQRGIWFTRNQAHIPPYIWGLPVTTIRTGAFSRDYFRAGDGRRRGSREGRRLRNVTLPYTLIYIGEGAFLRNRLTSVTIPDGVTHIRNSAFHRNRITYVSIPDSVIYIGGSAFRRNRLTYVTVPRDAFVADTAFDSGVTVIRRE